MLALLSAAFCSYQTRPLPLGGRPVVVSTHGTIGVASYCVGSNLGPKYWPGIDGLKQFLAAGYVVVAPDYQGLGTPGPASVPSGRLRGMGSA